MKLELYMNSFFFIIHCYIMYVLFNHVDIYVIYIYIFFFPAFWRSIYPSIHHTYFTLHLLLHLNSSSNHLPATAVLPASSSGPREPIGARLLLLHLSLVVIGHIQGGVVVVTILHRVKLLSRKLRHHKMRAFITFVVSGNKQ